MKKTGLGGGPAARDIEVTSAPQPEFFLYRLAVVSIDEEDKRPFPPQIFKHSFTGQHYRDCRMRLRRAKTLMVG